MKLRMKVRQLEVLPAVDNKMADGRSCEELGTAAPQSLWRAITQLQTQGNAPSFDSGEVPDEL